MSENIKRKRLQKTSAEQYEEYLRVMGEDPIFRTGIINPTINPNHVENCWKTLTSKLNATGNGPALTPIEWKKRFNDWKNSTRAKYRKIVEERKKTGGGSSTAGVLTPIEERGLSVWGLVTVTGTPKVQISGGFPKPPNTNAEMSSQIISANDSHYEDIEENDVNPHDQEITVAVVSPPQRTANEGSAVVPQPSPMKFPKRVSCVKRKPVRSLQSVGEDFLNIYKNNSETSEKRKFDLEERKLDLEERTLALEERRLALEERRGLEERRLALEERRLKFEVEKYKFENLGFSFDE